MANEARNKTNQEPVNSAQIGKIRKARPGYRLIATEAPAEGELEIAYSEEEIVGKQIYHMEDGSRKLCYMVEVPEDKGKQMKADFEREKAAHTRKTRCHFQGKNGKTKMCPFEAKLRMKLLRELDQKGYLDDRAKAFLKSGQTFSCTNCPIPDRCKLHPHTENSMQLMSENGQDIASHGFGSAESLQLGPEVAELMAKLKKDEPLLFQLVVIRFNNPDFKDEDIWKAMGIGSTQYYKISKKLKVLGYDYIDINITF